MDSLLPKTKAGKGATYGSVLLLILGYLAELRVSVGEIETKVVAIEKRIELIDQEETLRKILTSTRKGE